MNSYVWGNKKTQFFFQLSPDVILNSIEKLGIQVTGRCLTLNSMENRVFEIERHLDQTSKNPSDNFLVAKFYRPGRWSEQQIQDEHDFLFELKEQDIPVIAPLKIDGKSLFKDAETNLFFCLYPKKGGRIPQEMTEEQLEIMGRTLARLHNVGASKKASARISITPQSFGRDNLQFLLENKLIAHQFEESYKEHVLKICDKIEPLFENIEKIRIHGDCHWGNVIDRESEGLFLVDFDDMLNGPPVQDIWLIVPGMDREANINREILLEAYESMRPFSRQSLNLIEPLRTLRYIHFAAWIGKRYKDPAFRNAFPHYGTDTYWHTQLQDLRDQWQKINPTTEIYY